MPTNLIPNYAVIVTNTEPGLTSVAINTPPEPVLLVGAYGPQGPAGTGIAPFITTTKWGVD